MSANDSVNRILFRISILINLGRLNIKHLRGQSRFSLSSLDEAWLRETIFHPDNWRKSGNYATKKSLRMQAFFSGYQALAQTAFFLRRRAIALTNPKPASIMAYDSGSGTAVVKVP